MPDLANVLRGRRSERINVLELGAGCGIVGIALAQYFPNAVVQLTDLADAQDILSKNLDQATPAKNSILKAWTLVWDAEPDEADFNYNFDLVMISDCTYNADSCPDLVATLARVSSISPGVRILVAMKRRHDSEHIFFDLMADAHMRVLERSTIELPHEMSNLDLKTPETELYLFGCIADGQSTPDPTITA